MRSVRSESGDASRDDEASTSAWIIAALVALAILLILLVLAVGVGVWMSKGNGVFGDQAGIASGAGVASEGAGTDCGPAPAPDKPKQETNNPPSQQSPDEAHPTESPSDASSDAKGAPVGKSLPPEDVPAVGEETPSSVSDGPSRKKKGPSVAGGSFFGLRADGKRFVYVVDCSGSMAGDPYARATMELLSSIANLEKTQQFFVILYSTESYPMFYPTLSQEFFSATDDSLRQTKIWLKDFSDGGGGTNPEPALEQALAMNPDAIYFLTDGAIPPTTPTTVSNANSKKTPVHTIGFVNRAGEEVLKRIAEENRGQYKFVP